MASVGDSAHLVQIAGERVKELNALHRTARVLQDDSRPTHLLISEVLPLLPPAWQYPEITGARIYFQDLEVQSPNFRQTEWMQTVTFNTRAGERGGIEICYLEDRPPAVEGPFLAEERDLINSLAEMLRSHFQRDSALKALEKTKEELENQVLLRTRQLEEVNESLRRQLVEYQRAQAKIEDYQWRLRRLASELSLSEARHRRHIAQEIHDQIGQALAFIRMRVTRFSGNAVFCGFEDSILEILRLVDQTINSTRSLTFDISPPVLYELGLSSALNWLGEQFERKHALAVQVSASRSVDRVPDDTRVVIYHAVQELLVNTVKHADAGHVWVKAEVDEGEVVVSVSDDGRGFDVGETVIVDVDRMTFGLFSIRERMEYLGGSAVVESSPGSGTTITLTTPILPGPQENVP